MAKSTIITCNADALSRAADAILARGKSPSKNAILNAVAAAIAGPGHDWGFVKNAPGGALAQPGLAAAPSGNAEAPAPAHAWVVSYDERDAWGRAPRLFASKEAALAAVAADHGWWKHPDHPKEAVLAALERSEEYLFVPEEDEDTDAYHDADPYKITILRSEIEAPSIESDPAERLPSDIMVAFDMPALEISQDIDDAVLFHNRASLEAYMERHGLSSDPESPDFTAIHRADDCTFVATIRPQAWQNDYAIPVDPEGETSWTVDPDELDPDQDFLNYLTQSRHAPTWVKDWIGPFEVDLDIEAPEPKGD